MEKRDYLIYCHTSPSGKKYIGQTKDYNTRCNYHKSAKHGNCRIFKKAIQKYGWDSFTHEILKDNLTLSEANDLEAFYIKDYNTLAPNGYNLKIGGDNSILSEETKSKISASHLKLNKKGKVRKSNYSYTFINPDGNVIIINSLPEFCRKNNLSSQHMASVASGKRKHHRQWTKGSDKCRI